MDFVGGAVCIDDTHAIAVIATCGEVAFADALEEFSLFAFEAVGGTTTNGHALAACFNGQVVVAPPTASKAKRLNSLSVSATATSPQVAIIAIA